MIGTMADHESRAIRHHDDRALGRRLGVGRPLRLTLMRGTGGNPRQRRHSLIACQLRSPNESR